MSLKTNFNPLGGTRKKKFPFVQGQVLYEADGYNGGQYSWFDLPQGIYQIEAVGAGGYDYSFLNSYAMGCYAGGGSGGFALCDVKIPEGRYLIFPATTNVRNAGILSEFGTEMFIAYNGENAHHSINNLLYTAVAGQGGGVLYPSGFEVVTQYHWTGGNTGEEVLGIGAYASGGASVYPYGNLYGKGAGTSEQPNQGYIKLTFLRRY